MSGPGCAWRGVCGDGERWTPSPPGVRFKRGLGHELIFNTWSKLLIPGHLIRIFLIEKKLRDYLGPETAGFGVSPGDSPVFTLDCSDLDCSEGSVAKNREIPGNGLE